MLTEMIPVVVVLILGFIGLFYLLSQKLNQIKADQTDEEAMKILMEWLKEMRGSLDKNLGGVQQSLDKSSEVLNRNLEGTAQAVIDVQKSIQGVQKEVGVMSEIGRSMKALQDLLKAPKLRGNIGEQILGDILAQSLPREHFEMQYAFRSTKRVDAVVRTDEGLIPVDSKFPLENFQAMAAEDSEEKREAIRKIFTRDVKKHIDNIAANYILPNEGTLDFALMYIPSEAIYYEVVVNTPELVRYSQAKRVLPVSPNVFYSYIRAILIGLEGKKIEERAKQILAAIRGLQGDSNKFAEGLSKLTGHITRAKTRADEASVEYHLLQGKIGSLNRIAGEEPDQKKLIE